MENRFDKCPEIPFLGHLKRLVRTLVKRGFNSSHKHAGKPTSKRPTGMHGFQMFKAQNGTSEEVRERGRNKDTY